MPDCRWMLTRDVFLTAASRFVATAPAGMSPSQQEGGTARAAPPRLHALAGSATTT